jgi:NAD(P)-dependent dehydrogenase (short-subunit alcohol dehydrogenase family)
MVEMEFPLALVTGAAHRLGRVFAMSLARQGYAILLHYHRSAEEAVAVASEIRLIGVPVHLVQADLTKITDIYSLFSTIDSLPHKLRVLVNSAGTMQRADIRTLSVTDWDATMALNLRTPFLLAQQAVERMQDGGLIVNVSDAGADKAWTGFPAYTVSKAGLESLTHVLAKALAPKIRVNAIAPGLALPSEKVAPEEWQKLVDRLPLKHPASVDDIAAALEYLLKNESVTGQTIIVDGGYSLI